MLTMFYYTGFVNIIFLSVAWSHGSEVGSHQQGEERAREKIQKAARSRD